jgi:hypothetical protein
MCGIRYIGTSTSDGMMNIFLEFVPGGSIRQLLEKFGCFEEPVRRPVHSERVTAAVIH